MDEVLLLIDIYFTIKQQSGRKTSKEYIETLSSNLRKLSFFPELSNSNRFRNFTGLKSVLSHLMYSSNDYSRKPSKTQLCVIEYFESRQKLLHNITFAILDLCEEKQPNFPNYNNFIGGNILMNKHIYIEKKDSALQIMLKGLQQQQRFTCGICNHDLYETYGQQAEYIIEIHYTYPLYLYRNNMQTISQYALPICPTCHKIAHEDVLSVEEEPLRKLLKN